MNQINRRIGTYDMTVESNTKRGPETAIIVNPKFSGLTVKIGTASHLMIKRLFGDKIKLLY